MLQTNLSFPERRILCHWNGEAILQEEGLNEKAATLAGFCLADTLDERSFRDSQPTEARHKVAARHRGEDSESD